MFKIERKKTIFQENCMFKLANERFSLQSASRENQFRASNTNIYSKNYKITKLESVSKYLF